MQDKERQGLDEYIKIVATEPWAIKSQRMTNYLQSRIKKKGISAPAPAQAKRDSLAETRARIGFVGSSYSAIDLIGTNEICRGSAAQLNIEGSGVILSKK